VQESEAGVLSQNITGTFGHMLIIAT